MTIKVVASESKIASDIEFLEKKVTKIKSHYTYTRTPATRNQRFSILFARMYNICLKSLFDSKRKKNDTFYLVLGFIVVSFAFIPVWYLPNKGWNTSICLKKRSWFTILCVFSNTNSYWHRYYIHKCNDIYFLNCKLNYHFEVDAMSANVQFYITFNWSVIVIVNVKEFTYHVLVHRLVSGVFM